MSVTDTRRAPSAAGESRNGDQTRRSDTVTDTRTAQKGAIPRVVTCKECRAEIPPDVMMVICAFGPETARGYRPGDTFCCDCANASKVAGWLLPWRRWGARGKRDDYCRRCAYCGRGFYGAMARRYCSDDCGERTRNARRNRSRVPTARPCVECGARFTPPRADGQYCSNACRQKAYRERPGRTQQERDALAAMLREYDGALLGGAQ